MCACSCFHWALFVSFHLKHTSDLTWTVPSWNDTTGKLKDLSTLKKSNAFHSDKHICRSAALLREVEKWSPLLPLILCITSCLSPSSLLKISFTVESSLVLGGAMMMHWGTCIWKVTCRVWFSFFFFNIPPVSCNGHFLNMSPCAAALCPSRADTAISASLCWTVGWVCPILLFAQQQKFPLTIYFESSLRPGTAFWLCITSTWVRGKIMFSISMFRFNIGFKGRSTCLPLVCLHNFSGWNWDRTAALDKLL